ncbi:MAG TPA: hypothetical protein VLR71_21160 [Casimicrobiaceae bacterium]|nr:hypothetical protein [Casimicrobiaceae bacterium]
MSSVSSHVLKPFYRLRFSATGMSMLSAVLLPWLVYTATRKLAAAGLVMLIEATVRLIMSLYGGQLAHAVGGRRTFAASQAACAIGFALFACVLVAYPLSVPLALGFVVAALLFMQSGITLGNVVTEACTVAFLQAGAKDVPARVRSVDLLATACALPLGGWLVFAFNAPLALIALGAALALAAAVLTVRIGAVFDHADGSIPAPFSLVDGAVWRWLARTPAAQLQTAFLLVVSVPITMLFGALPFLLADKLPAGLPDWLKPTDVLFLTHYKAIEAATAAAVVLAWTRYASAPGRTSTAATFAFAGYLAALLALTHSQSALAVAFAALALAASFSPLLVWVRQQRAELVPPGNRHRVAGVLVALDSLAYVAGALAVQITGFAMSTLGALALIAALLFVALVYGARSRVPARAIRPGPATNNALPPLAEKLAIYRRYLHDQRAFIETRLADAVPRLGLVKRATPPPTYLTPLAVSPVGAVRPIGCGLTPLVLPRALYEAGLRTARVAAHSEEIAATHRPLDAVRADAAAQGWSAAVLNELLPQSPAELQSRLAASFHRLRVDLLLRPEGALAQPPRGDPLGARFAPLEVNNGGSQGHWICSSVNDVLLAGLGLEGRPVFDKPHALIVDVYEAFNAWLKERIGRRRFRALFPRGAAPFAFVTGPYSGRQVNDIEGPRIADFIARRYGVDAAYFIGIDELELTERLRVGDREMHFVRRRGGPATERFIVWSDLYVTDCMDYFESALRGDDARTRAMAQAVLRGHVLGISAWPGRELLENDKAHLVEKAHAAARSTSMGLTPLDAALLQEAAPDAFALTSAQADAVIEARDSWVLKGRFGCGGSSVIVGAHPSWPTQRLPALETDADGRVHVGRHAIGNIALDAGIAITVDFEGRITSESWAVLWPHLVRFAARSPGYYIAQSCVEPEPFQAMIYDGRKIDEFAATTDFAAAYTLGWRNGKPRVQPSGALCRAVPRGHPHTNITTRGALLPVMSEEEFDRLFVALGLDRYVAPALRPVPATAEGNVSPGVPA